MCNERKRIEHDCIGKQSLLEKGGVDCPLENLQHREVANTRKYVCIYTCAFTYIYKHICTPDAHG